MLDNADMRQFGRYHYAHNNPYRYNDPDGRVANFVIGAGVGLGVDLLVQGIQIAAGTRDRIDVGSLAVSAATGAVGVGIAGKVGKLASMTMDATVSASSSQLKGEEFSAAAVAVDVALGRIGSSAGRGRVADAADIRLARKQADRTERIGSAPRAREAQRKRAAEATPAVEREIDQRAAATGIAAGNLGSSGVRELERDREPRR